MPKKFNKKTSDAESFVSNVNKVAKALGLKVDSFGDNSGMWIQLLDNKEYTVNLNFDSLGDKLLSIQVFKKIYDVVDEKKVVDIQINPPEVFPEIKTTTPLKETKKSGWTEYSIMADFQQPPPAAPPAE